VLETSKGCPQVGQNEGNKVKSGESLKKKIYSILLHQKYVFLSGSKWTWRLLFIITFRMCESKGLQGLGFQMKDLVYVALSGKVFNSSYRLNKPWEFWLQSHTLNNFWIFSGMNGCWAANSTLPIKICVMKIHIDVPKLQSWVYRSGFCHSK